MSVELKLYMWGQEADKGNGSAHFLMAHTYAVGDELEKNPEKALALFHDAAGLGNPGAQLLLSHYYDVGFGVTADKAQAYKWALLAVTHGSPVAKQLMPDLEKTLTPEQHAEGQSLAKAWQVTTLEAHEAEHGHAHHDAETPEDQKHSHAYDPKSFFPGLDESEDQGAVAAEPATPADHETPEPAPGDDHHQGHDAVGHDHHQGHDTTSHGHGHHQGGDGHHTPADEGAPAP